MSGMMWKQSVENVLGSKEGERAYQIYRRWLLLWNKKGRLMSFLLVHFEISW